MQSPSRSRLTRALVAVPLVAGMLFAASTLGSSPARPGTRTAASTGYGGAAASTGYGAGGIAPLQEHLRAQPRDARSWAALGLAYVEQARTSTDPSWYDKADEVLARSIELQPADNDVALAGQAALAAARHDFAAALDLAEQALAINPVSVLALGSRTDALTELGRYRQALAAAQEADALRPGVSSFARLAYQYELRGQDQRASALLARVAADRASTNSFALVQLSDLARRSGDLDSAQRHVDVAARAGRSDPAVMAARARLWVARGDVRAAEAQWTEVVAIAPVPEYLTAYGELLLAQGRGAEARAQFDVVGVWASLAADSGANVDLETALFEADHGDPSVALSAARAEWERRQSVHAADAMAWALMRTGEAAAALTYAKRATELGTPDAAFLAHRGAIEARLGHTDVARRYLDDALRADPGWSPWQVKRFERLRAGLDGA